MDNDRGNEHDYALAGKIMLIAIVILFIVILIMLCLHVHVRMYLQRARHRRQQRTRRVPGQQFIFYVNPATLTGSATRGLDAAVISSLPVFNFSPKTHPNTVLECSVCLSEFEIGETGRVLPKCNHSFHIGCIDKWLRSHTACPLCRAPVEPTPDQETRHEVTVDLCETDPGSSSGLNRSGPVVSSSSCSINGKPSSLVGVTVEVPARNGGESSCDSPSFRSPMSRVLSFTRILSRERKASVSPSSGCVVVCGSGTELDAERGVRVETQ